MIIVLSSFDRSCALLSLFECLCSRLYALKTISLLRVDLSRKRILKSLDLNFLELTSMRLLRLRPDPCCPRNHEGLIK